MRFILTGIIATLSFSLGIGCVDKTDTFNVWEDPCVEIGYGIEVDQCLKDYTLINIEDEMENVSDFDGELLWLVQSTGYCPFCYYQAASYPVLSENYPGLRIREVLLQGESHEPATVEDLEVWEELTFGGSELYADPKYLTWELNEDGTVPLNIFVDKNKIILGFEKGYSVGHTEDMVLKYWPVEEDGEYYLEDPEK